MQKSQNDDTRLEELVKEASTTFDMAKEADMKLVSEMATKILETTSAENFDDLDLSYSQREDVPMAFKLAVKLARSKSYLTQFQESAFVSVVFAIYKENNRILRSDQHPNGEDFLNVKVQQLNWLFEKSKNFAWELLLVDDGCPNDSGKIAEAIIKEKDYKNVRVLYLEDAIKNGLEVASGLGSTKDSQKGGSILYGMFEAAQTKRENHVVIFTDADLSTHLGQVGLLVKPILVEKNLSAIGSRREKNSVVIKGSQRNNRGKLFIYSWKRLIPLKDIIDTQCGFKAFDATIVQKIVAPSVEKKFAFDIELLWKTQCIRENAIRKVGIAWIDSEAESTTKDLQPYLPMLKSISLMYDSYVEKKNPEGDEFSDFYKSLTEERWNSLVNNIPQEICDGNPADFSTFNSVRVSDLQKNI